MTRVETTSHAKVQALVRLLFLLSFSWILQAVTAQEATGRPGDPRVLHPIHTPCWTPQGVGSGGRVEGAAGGAALHQVDRVAGERRAGAAHAAQLLPRAAGAQQQGRGEGSVEQVGGTGCGWGGVQGTHTYTHTHTHTQTHTHVSALSNKEEVRDRGKDGAGVGKGGGWDQGGVQGSSVPPPQLT